MSLSKEKRKKIVGPPPSKFYIFLIFSCILSDLKSSRHFKIKEPLVPIL
jgi:hypothetical protein